jgi:tetratricopeptide (TPR) repeat protein
VTDTEQRALLREAARLEQSGRMADAETAYRHLLSRCPDLPDSWYNLARVQRSLGHFDAALASYQQALDRNVRDPEEVHLNRGVIYSDDLRREDAAERELIAALARNPAYVPALANLANLKSDLGQRDEAMALYQRILAIDPHSCSALARYADLAPVNSPDDPLIEKLKALLADGRRSAAERAELGFALGRAQDAAGDYDAAFRTYAEANRASRENAPRGAVLYDRARHEQLIDRIIAAFPLATPTRPSGDRIARPIFICGMFRSGSTLTEQVLAGHSQVKAGGEINFIPALATTELSPYPERVAAITPQQFEAIAERYLAGIARLFPEAAHVTDKRPDNFLYIGLIKRLFPDARIVHTTRDPQDTCLSVHFLHLDHSMGYALDLIDTAHHYREYRRLMAHWKSLYAADILDFDYDAFVRAPEPAIRRLLDFCGLEWEQGCMEFHKVGNAVKTASVWQVREPLYLRSSGRWRHYARQLEPLRAYLGDLVDGPTPSGG